MTGAGGGIGQTAVQDSSSTIKYTHVQIKRADHENTNDCLTESLRKALKFYYIKKYATAS